MEERYRFIFDNTFEETRAHLLGRRLQGQFGVEELQSLLESTYVNQGLDWVGRGELFRIRQEATIAAMELTLAEWQQEST